MPQTFAQLVLATLVCAGLIGSTRCTKISESRYRAGEDGNTGGDDAACDGEERRPGPPHIVLEGQAADGATFPISNTFTVDGRTVDLRPLHEELQLTYVHNLLAPVEIDELVRLASARNGWSRSPLKQQRSGERLDGSESKDDRRNSSSCPLLWPAAYAGKLHKVHTAPGGEELLAELELVTNLTSRVANLFTQTGMELSADFIEPLQLVRYASTEVFKPHHDYHTPGPDGELKSSVQGEQRAFTVLLLGTTLPPGAGGETHFPQLGLAVSPTKGDAIVWANVDAEGTPNPRSLHEGRPPAEGFEKVAINCWIANQPFNFASSMAM